MCGYDAFSTVYDRLLERIVQLGLNYQAEWRLV